MIRSVRRTLLSAAAPLVFACAHDYRDPDPAAGPTARVVIENPSAESVYISMAAAVVHVYESRSKGAKTYLGTVSVADQNREIRVAADRPALFHLSIDASDERSRVGVLTCAAEIGFVPRTGATYRLIVGEHFQRKCSLQILDAMGAPASEVDPREYDVR